MKIPSRKNNFGEQLADLEKIINNLENGNAPLDGALEQFQVGVEISRDLKKESTTTEGAVARLIGKNDTRHELDSQDAAAPEE